jgi:hypothetical protein
MVEIISTITSQAREGGEEAVHLVGGVVVVEAHPNRLAVVGQPLVQAECVVGAVSADSMVSGTPAAATTWPAITPPT